MRCEEVRRTLAPQPGPRSATGELAEAFAHFDHCTACQQFFTRQRALRERLQRLSEVSAPPFLLQRIRHGIARTAPVRRPVRPRGRWLVGGGLAVATALSVILVGLGREAPIPEEVIRHLVAQASTRSLSLGEGTDAVTTSNAAQLGRWFAERVPDQVDIPQIDGAVLVGGRVIIDLAGTPTAAIEYLFRNRPVTLFALPSGHVMGRSVGGEEIAAGSSGGYQVALWRERGLARAVVGPLPRSAVVGFAAECRAKALRAS